MPAGSTKPRSTSQSCNARSSPRTTSPTSQRSSSNCSRSADATSRLPPRSNGSSPVTTSTASPTDSTHQPLKPPDQRIRRRTSEPEHLVHRDGRRLPGLAASVDRPDGDLAPPFAGDYVLRRLGGHDLGGAA